MKELSDLEVGDWVYYIPDGWQKILKFRDDENYPVLVDGRSFSKEGKYHEYDIYPVLYTYDPINGTEPPKPKIDWDKVLVGTSVIVWDDDSLKFERFFVCTGRKKTAPFDTLSDCLLGVIAWKYCELAGYPKKEWLK